jgi:hypothetical protein
MRYFSAFFARQNNKSFCMTAKRSVDQRGSTQLLDDYERAIKTLLAALSSLSQAAKAPPPTTQPNAASVAATPSVIASTPRAQTIASVRSSTTVAMTPSSSRSSVADLAAKDAQTAGQFACLLRLITIA